MFLLIQWLPIAFSEIPSYFTFQYVSINTETIVEGTERTKDFTFQYVSINTETIVEGTERTKDFTFQYVSINTNNRVYIRCTVHTLHSNMFLLILFSAPSAICLIYSFTFQYVSINTEYFSVSGCRYLSLHSNMFLLIPYCLIHFTQH